MAGGPVGSKSSKVSDSAGETGTYKKDSYAKGPVNKAFVGSKVGVTNKKGYSGPNVTMGSFSK